MLEGKGMNGFVKPVLSERDHEQKIVEYRIGPGQPR